MAILACEMLLQQGKSNSHHLAVIFLQIEADESEEESAHGLVITEEEWWKLMATAWADLPKKLKTCVEAIAERTIKYLSPMSTDLFSFRCHIKHRLIS